MQTNRDFREKYLNKELYLNKDKKISSYPQNINLANFRYFLRAPTFVYEESYPRSGPFNLKYLILKFLIAVFIIVELYYIYTERIEPVILKFDELYFIDLIIRIYIPVVLHTLLMFYLLFECVLQAYAELSTFGDREFYSDFWNSTDLEEFNRKWNKIVHEFLYRHVYIEFKTKYKFSPFASKLITFLFSAIFHEFAFTIVMGVFKPYLFVLMFCQLPLIVFKKFFRKTTFGNMFFFISVTIGNSLIFILYNKEHIRVYGHKLD